MNAFRIHCAEPFAEDLDAWRRHGWPIGEGARGMALGVLRFSGLRATLMHRLAFWATVQRVPVLPTLLSQLNTVLHGIEMPSSVPIGPGLYMPHTVGTVITALSIGRDVTIQGGVTIGMRNEADFPRIENDVEIGAGARVLGPIAIGARSKVGANAVVVRDVPPDCTALGIPARALPHQSEALRWEFGDDQATRDALMVANGH